MRAILLAINSGLDKAIARVHGGLLRYGWGMSIGAGCRISLTARLDKTNPRGIHIGQFTGVSSRADILAFDPALNQLVDTWIGERCHIGAGSVIYPGVKVGDGCVVAPGAVVLRDVGDSCVVAGNPARVVEKDIRTGRYGVRLDLSSPKPPGRSAAVLDAEAAKSREKIGALQ
jgi:acetyltransferase-like isoleucine patch superfamily enzyme